MPRGFGAVWLTAGLLALGGYSVAAGQGAASQRLLPYDPRSPISGRLRNDDAIVVVDRHWDVVDLELGSRPIEATIAYVQAVSDVAAIVDVNDVSGILVENGAWIQTHIIGRVRRVLSSSTHASPLRRGGNITVIFEGGEVHLGMTLVRAGDVVAMQSRQQYLMFLIQNNGTYQASVTPMLVRDGRVLNVNPKDEGAAKLDGMALSTIQRVIRLDTRDP